MLFLFLAVASAVNYVVFQGQFHVDQLADDIMCSHKSQFGNSI